MIKNVVFDLGRVMVEFDPVTYLRGFGYPEELVQRLHEIVFGRDWYLHDRGDYRTIDDLRAALVEKHPAYAAELTAVLRGDWVKIHYLKTDTAAYMAELKRRGYGIYILSNLSVESYEFIRQYDFFRTVDGGVFSYQENSCKPEEKIYRALLDRYGLVPDETVFLDDNPDNIAEADRLGIHGILFTDIDSAKAATEALLAGYDG
ncbi:MAG: HAD family phosphatase [Clostridia bacterium]|nr:HAD family phosphatase [Clostridia bacterium]